MGKPKLQPLHLTSLHHAEVGQLIVRFYEDFSRASLDATTDPDFKKLFDELHAKIPAYNAALKQIRASEETEKIEQADHERDADIQALKDSIKPYRKAKTQAEKEAYTALDILLNQYKNLADENLEKQTAHLSILLTALRSAEYDPHVNQLNINKFVTYLEDSATSFNDIFSQRSYKTSQKEIYDVKALRRDLIDHYRTMINYIAAVSSVKADVFYTNTLATINNGRSYFDNVVLSRRKAASKPKIG